MDVLGQLLTIRKTPVTDTIVNILDNVNNYLKLSSSFGADHPVIRKKCPYLFMPEQDIHTGYWYFLQPILLGIFEQLPQPQSTPKQQRIWEEGLKIRHVMELSDHLEPDVIYTTTRDGGVWYIVLYDNPDTDWVTISTYFDPENPEVATVSDHTGVKLSHHDFELSQYSMMGMNNFPIGYYKGQPVRIDNNTLIVGRQSFLLTTDEMNTLSYHLNSPEETTKNIANLITSRSIQAEPVPKDVSELFQSLIGDKYEEN